MDAIVYIDRRSGKEEIEKVYGAAALDFIYGDALISRIFGTALLHGLIKTPFFSALYGYWQSQSCTAKKIRPFIEEFQLDPSEFLDDPASYQSFNDFFIRKLKPEARPLAKDSCLIPADGRYRFYPNIDQVDGFIVKGEKFDLGTLLEDVQLAQQYAGGTMVIARLCPSDCHRFYFPCDCTPGPTQFINGWLYSVNPMAVKRDIHIFTTNKRTLCELKTDHFGKVLFLEIGATNVGSIHQTYTPHLHYAKGAEKGYFSFGASALILLFEPGRLRLSDDLMALSTQNKEIRCLIGQPLGNEG